MGRRWRRVTCRGSVACQRRMSGPCREVERRRRGRLAPRVTAVHRLGHIAEKRAARLQALCHVCDRLAGARRDGQVQARNHRDPRKAYKTQGDPRLCRRWTGRTAVSRATTS
ncbi:hypothetical protein VFPBJ_04156 [Purpureocillium lilacinum]|uniref:Uncharacterized protein n=1 Tax=Purpureocillium lilacinum TaxID=33203 RepID=A0A179GUX5_PURLI|nr:hypothetical protein VFPBJ_04156 [Purpureocillium lilacinum]